MFGYVISRLVTNQPMEDGKGGGKEGKVCIISHAEGFSPLRCSWHDILSTR